MVRTGRPRKNQLNEVLIARRYAEICNSKKVAEEFRTSPGVVLRIVKLSGLNIGSKGARRMFSEVDEKKMVSMYAAGKSQDEIAKVFKISQQGVGKVLKRFSVVMRSTKSGIDEYFFDNINTEEKAYWLGFLSADGNIGKDNAIRLELQRKDGLHVVKFSRAIGMNGGVYSRSGDRSEVGVEPKSVVMANSLREKGLQTSVKSLLLKPFKFIVHGDLERHYWRGFVDGDGGIWGGDTIGICGTKDVCDGLKMFLLKSGISTNASVLRSGDHLWKFSVNSKQVVECVQLLYADACVYLERKMAIARKILGVNNKNGVELIDGYTSGMFLEAFHYLKTLPIACKSYGLFEDGNLLGVAVVGSPSSPALETEFSGKAIELRRFALLENRKNLASQFLSRVVKLVKVDYKGSKTVLLSYADGAQGHEGTIYKAIGAKEDGSSGRQIVGVIGDRRLTGVHLQKYVAENGIGGVKFEESPGKKRYIIGLD
jgi:hypothetical protein